LEKGGRWKNGFSALSAQQRQTRATVLSLWTNAELPSQPGATNGMPAVGSGAVKALHPKMCHCRSVAQPLIFCAAPVPISCVGPTPTSCAPHLPNYRPNCAPVV
jgi:hypothetical protein